MKGTLYEDQYTFLIIFRSVLLRMRNVSHKLCKETQIRAFYIQQVFSENRALYKMMWNNVAELGRTKMAISRIRIAFWIAKVTNIIRICNTYCFSTAAIVVQTRFALKFILKCNMLIVFVQTIL